MAHSGRNRQGVESSKPVALGSCEQPAGFLRGQSPHLTRLWPWRIDEGGRVVIDDAPALCLRERPVEDPMEVENQSWRQPCRDLGRVEALDLARCQDLDRASSKRGVDVEVDVLGVPVPGSGANRMDYRPELFL